MKTNKSFTKRFKVTRTGKIVGRAKGQDHYNAKESRKTKSAKRRRVLVPMTNKSKARFLPRT
ncbi:50S ribosomal protein L35 [Candidatus Wolfebacteria bacterium]|nr:50S ribosomal protein L35 [Candidatus Wolfebacteria bacterium]